MTAELVLCYSEDLGLATDLVRIARAIAAESPPRVEALVLPGAPADAADRLAAAGAHAVTTVAGTPSTDPHVLAKTLRAALDQRKPALFLTASTKRTREVLGRLAGELDLGAITGATSVQIASDGIRVDREMLSGTAVSVERLVRRPALVGILPGTTAPPASPTTPVERSELPIAPPNGLTARAELRAKPVGGVELEKSDRVVTVGRGMKKKEDTALIEALAKAMKADVGCTRPLAAELGWFTDDHWIGLTGHRVHPKVYVAVGVSGAVQHLVGMRSSKVVVAINSDANAPIFAQADYGVVGDLYQVVPALTKALGG